MSPRDWRQRVDDILAAMDRVETFTRGLTLDAGRVCSLEETSS